MKALSILQPWASVIAFGHKRIETRSWQTAYRGPLLIHAGKGRQFLFDTLTLQRAGLRWDIHLPLGAIIAVAELVDCLLIRRRMDNGAVELRGEPPGVGPWAWPDPTELALGDYTPGRYGWVLANVRPLRNPVACPGKQGLWQPSPEIIAAVTAEEAQGE